MSFRFLKFPVYTDIKKYINEVYKLSSKFPREEQFGMINQIRRAVVSIALNLAEGSDRGSDNEFKRFINTALGSLNETIAILDISADRNFILKEEYELLVSKAESIAKQLSGLRKSLNLK